MGWIGKPHSKSSWHPSCCPLGTSFLATLLAQSLLNPLSTKCQSELLPVSNHPLQHQDSTLHILVCSKEFWPRKGQQFCTQSSLSGQHYLISIHHLLSYLSKSHGDPWFISHDCPTVYHIKNRNFLPSPEVKVYLVNPHRHPIAGVLQREDKLGNHLGKYCKGRGGAKVSKSGFESTVAQRIQD